jgi:hypothetical protein
MRRDLPVHVQLEVAVVLCRLEALSLAVVVEDAVVDGPVRQVLAVGLLLHPGQFLGRVLLALRQFDGFSLESHTESARRQ